MRSGWGRDAHIPALIALPEFEIKAVSTSRQETADETAKHLGVPHAFADPYKMVQHPDVDLVAICVRVPFHHQLGMAALNAAASISTANGRLRPPLSRLNRCVIWPSVRGSTIWWDYKPAVPPRSTASRTWSPTARLARCFPAR
jgi:hypothetical protein